MVTHHLTITSYIMLSRLHMVNTKYQHPLNGAMSNPLKPCEKLCNMLNKSIRPSRSWCSDNTLIKSRHVDLSNKLPITNSNTINPHSQSKTSKIICKCLAEYCVTTHLPISTIEWSWSSRVVKSPPHHKPTLIKMHTPFKSSPLKPYLIKSRKWCRRPRYVWGKGMTM